MHAAHSAGHGGGRGKAVKISHQLKLKLFLDDGQGGVTGSGTHLSAVHASISRLPSFLLFCVLCQIKKEIKMNIFFLWLERGVGSAAECECICMLRVSHCAHFIFHSRLCSPPPLRHRFPAPCYDTPFVDVQAEVGSQRVCFGVCHWVWLWLWRWL